MVPRIMVTRTVRTETVNPALLSGTLTLGGKRRPARGEMLGRAPGEGLRRQCWIARAARAHDRRAEHAEIRHLMAEAPAVDDVRLGVVAHARSAVRVRRHAHGAEWLAQRGNGPR